MTINITITHQWPQGQPGGITVRDLHETETRIRKDIQMTRSEQAVKLAEIAAEQAESQAKQDEAFSELSGEIGALNDKIVALQKQIQDGEVDPEIAAAIEGIAALSKGTVTKSRALADIIKPVEPTV